MRRLTTATVLLVLLAARPLYAQQRTGELTEAQIAQAISLGQQQKVPTVHVGKSRNFDVSIGGPVSRIATAAAKASKQNRPFTAADVPASLKAPSYVVTALSNSNGLYLTAQHIVLQSKDVSHTTIQPQTEDGDVNSAAVGHEAFFDRLPPNDFDIVVGTFDQIEERFSVTAEMRADIQ